MPSKSPAQSRFMRAVAHGWKKPGGGGPTREVAREFVNADKRRSKVQGYNFGGVATGPGMYGGGVKPQGALSRDPRAMPPQMTTNGPGSPMRGGAPQMRRPMQKPMMGGRPDPRSMPPQRGMPQRGGLGQVQQAMMKNLPGGRRMVPPSAPPMNQYPGGGHPNRGGRNPMMRQRNQMMGGRGPTSYLR